MSTRQLFAILLVLLTPGLVAGSPDLEVVLDELQAESDRLEAAAEVAQGAERVDELRRSGVALARMAEAIRQARCPAAWSFVDCVTWGETMVGRAEGLEVRAASRFAQALFDGRSSGADKEAVRAAGQELRALLTGLERRGATGENLLPLTPCMAAKQDQIEGAASRGGLPRGMEQEVRAKMKASEQLFEVHARVRQDPSWSAAHREQLDALDAALATEDAWLAADQAAFLDEFVVIWLTDAIGADGDEWTAGLPEGFRIEDGFLPRLACEDEPGAR